MNVNTKHLEDVVFDVISRALAEAGVTNETHRGMCLEVGIDLWRDRSAAELKSLDEQLSKSERRALLFSDIIQVHTIAMQSALIDSYLRGPSHGLVWIFNTLRGPGHLPDVDAAREMGGAQAYFDSQQAEHDAFRSQHLPPPEPDLVAAAESLVAECARQGRVLTIEQRPRPVLAMGSYDTVVSLREARHG